MYNVSSEFLTAIKQNSRTVKASIGVGDKLITNNIPNSDFPNGSTDWTPISASIEILNGELILTPTALNGQAYVITNAVVGHKYYSMAVVNSSSPNVYFSSYGNHKYHSGNGKYEVLSLLFTATTNNIRTGLVDENNSNWSSSKIKKPLIIDLTATYGVGNEPSQIYMDELFSKVGHFNGSNTVPLKFLDDRIFINALQNGNMVDTTKWTGSNSIISSASNKLSIVGTGSNSVIGAYNSTLIKPSIGSIVYVKATITSLTSLSNNIVVKLMDGTSGNIILSKTLKSPKAETSYVVTGMINIKYNFVDNLTFVVDSSYSNTTDSNSASFTVEKVTVMDITSLYGVGKEPSLAYIDSIMKSQGWFNSKQVSILETGEPTVISNFDIESSFGNNNLPTLGSTVSNKFKISMVNDLRIQQVFVDTTLRPYTGIDIGSGVYEWVALGEFYSDDSDVIKNKMNTTLEAFDKMMQYDNMSYDSTISYPTTILNMLIEIKNKYGIRYYDTSLLQNITFPDKPIGSVRQVLSILASYMTTNATMNEVGEVEFKSLTSSGFTIGASNYVDFKLLSDSQVAITKLILKKSDGLTSLIAGNDTGFTLEFENDSISEVNLQTAYARQFPLSYYAYNMKAQGMPHLQIGDTISFTDILGVVRTLNIINHKLTFNGGLTSEFKTDAPKSDTTTITSTGGSTVTKAVDQSTNNMKNELADVVEVIDGKLLLKVDKVTGKSLVLDTEITKLAGVSVGANKVLDSTTNGNILIDGVETNTYTHPTTHPPAIIVQDASNRFVTDADKTKWNLAQANNIVDVNATDLTDLGDTTLHYHASDRNRANHTGTQLASTISDLATTIRGTILTGLSTSTNAIITTTDTVLLGLGKLQKQVSDNLTTLTIHTGNTSNPHTVTKTQVGLSNVDNTTDLLKPVSTATQTALNLKISTNQKGVVNGVAQLDANGLVPSSQLPSYVNDILEYTSNALFPTTGEAGIIYLNTTTNLTYRWSGTVYVEVSPSIALGETSSTAYAGDKGKTTTDNVNAHLINTTNPHNVTKAQVGLGNVDNVNTNNQTPTYTVDSTNTPLTSGETLTTALGKIAKAISSLITHLADTVSHITSTERTNWNSASTNTHTHSNKTVLDNTTASYTTAEKTKLSGISASANNYILPVATTVIGGVKSGTDITVDTSGNVSVVDYSHNHVISNVDGLQSALDSKVDDSQVLTNVPAGAKFTDTVYVHPTNHAPSIITQDASNRFVTDTEKSTWNGKVDSSKVLTNVPLNAKFTDTVYTHPTTHTASMITQDANNRFVTDTEKNIWNGKATQTDINNSINAIQVGGRNYAKYSGGTSLSKIGLYNIDRPRASIVTVDNKICLQLLNDASSPFIRFLSVPTIVAEYTFSIWIKGTTNHSARINQYNGSSYDYTDFNVTTSWARYSFTFTGKADYNLIHLSDFAETTYITDWKLELGNKATDWTPAIEDMADKITNGTTATRPIPTHIGQTHFDTTLGKPIWCKTVATPVWVDSTGTTV